MAATVRIDGLKELDRELEKLSRAAGRGVLRRSLQKAAPPLVDRMKSNAPVNSGALRDSITASTKLAPRQSRLHRKMFRDMRSAAELFVGPSYNLGDGGRHAHLLEFGTSKMSPQPFARPAYAIADNIRNGRR